MTDDEMNDMMHAHANSVTPGRIQAGAALGNVRASMAQPPGLESRDPSPLDIAREVAQLQCQRAWALQSRLDQVVSKLQGPMPQADSLAKEAPRHGTLDELRSAQEDTLRALDAIDTMVSELERLL